MMTHVKATCCDCGSGFVAVWVPTCRWPGHAFDWSSSGGYAEADGDPDAYTLCFGCTAAGLAGEAAVLDWASARGHGG